MASVVTVEVTVDDTGEVTTDRTVEPVAEPTVEPGVELAVEPSAGTVVELVVETPAGPAVELVVETSRSSLEPRRQDGGNCTGVRKTMMQTTAARHATATASSLRLRSIAPKRVLKNRPLRSRKRAMLTELFTRPAYQNGTPLDTRSSPGGLSKPAMIESLQQAWCLRSQALGRPGLRGKPVRSRHGPATVTGAPRERAATRP